MADMSHFKSHNHGLGPYASLFLFILHLLLKECVRDPDRDTPWQESPVSNNEIQIANSSLSSLIKFTIIVTNMPKGKVSEREGSQGVAILLYREVDVLVPVQCRG